MNKDKIAIIGLGYVGLPLAVEFGKKRQVVGFDINETRIKELKSGNDSTLEVEPEELVKADMLNYSSSEADISECSIFIVTVPTPIDSYKKPNLSPLISASKLVGRNLKKGDIVIYESTVYPGCTEDDCVPILEEKSSLKFNIDFFCGYSPERINPGDKEHRLSTIKKIVSGSTPEVAKKVNKLYSEIITAGTHLATSIKVAEAAKVIENSQRDINIAFVNELALIFDRMNIDTNEVLDAASTKWNFLNFRPGLVGGHCIGVDPYYLTHKAESFGYHSQIVLSGRRLNDQMPIFISNKIVKLMIKKGITVGQSKLLLLGITFKENCPDIRNSKVYDLYNELLEFGIKVDVHDPWASAEEVKDEYNISLKDKLESEKYDAIVLAVAHNEFKSFDYNRLINNKSVIYDIKNVLDDNITDSRL